MKKIKILFIDGQAMFRNRIDYVLRFIEHHPHLKGQVKFVRHPAADVDITWAYGLSQADSFFIPAQKIAFSKTLPSFEALHTNVYTYESFPIHAIENKKETKQDFIVQHHFQFDILESIFFHISRMEEYYCKPSDLDQWDMMKSDKQFLVKNQLVQTPVVDHLIFAISKILGINHKPQKTVYRITHDIDEIEKDISFFKTIRSCLGVLWRRQSLSAIPRIWSAYFSKQTNLYDTFDWMLIPDRAIEKVIYFLVGGQTKYDTPYSLDSKRMKMVFQLCKTRNYVIGIHPSYATWDNKAIFNKEQKRLKSLIGSPIKHSRQHYLHFHFSKTAKIIDEQQMEEDSSLGFNDRIGFRCGTGFAYHLYNFEKEEAFTFKETPLIVMDSALFCETAYDFKKLQKLWDNFLSQNNKLTKITFNFHNSRFHDAWIHGIPLKTYYNNIFSRISEQD